MSELPVGRSVVGYLIFIARYRPMKSFRFPICKNLSIFQSVYLPRSRSRKAQIWSFGMEYSLRVQRIRSENHYATGIHHCATGIHHCAIGNHHHATGIHHVFNRLFDRIHHRKGNHPEASILSSYSRIGCPIKSASKPVMGFSVEIWWLYVLR